MNHRGPGWNRRFDSREESRASPPSSSVSCCQPGHSTYRGNFSLWLTRLLGVSSCCARNIHTPHWHGNVVSIEGHRTDIFSLLPAQFVTANMVPDNIGMWMFHCHVDEHMEAGMTAMYQVLP